MIDSNMIAINPNCLFSQLDQPPLGVSREYLIKGLDDKLVQAYHSYQVDTAVMYGANRTDAEYEMNDALDFEILLANVSKLTQSIFTAL